MDSDHLNVGNEDLVASLLELAANNDVEGFKRLIDFKPSSINEVGLWYGRGQRGSNSNQMVLQHRTPLMVAATYGNIDILKLIVSLPEVDVNRACGLDKTTALHCAASGGSVNSVEAVKVLLSAGADQNLTDGCGFRVVDVIAISPKLQETRLALETILKTDAEHENHGVSSMAESGLVSLPLSSMAKSGSVSPPLSPSPGNRSPEFAHSPRSLRINDGFASSVLEKKEYPVDPSLPDIKNGVYSTDEFRMFSFKVRPCSRAYSHDWTECPFVHPGENARRRDPRKYHYSCVMCPDFRKGTCRRGDMCEYAHGVFECWLHPAQYRTRLCKDGTTCNRRVCFFAHTQDELRPLHVSTGLAMPSPRAANAMDFAAAMSFLPNSPTTYTPPMSPSNNGIGNMAWPQQNVPPLHLRGSVLQSSRLRASLHARDIHPDELTFLPPESDVLNELSLSSLNRSIRSRTLTPSSLDEIFAMESSSPQYSDQALGSALFSPTQKSGVLNQFPLRNVDHSLMQGSGRMSPVNLEPTSPTSARNRVSVLAQQENQQRQFRSLSSRDLGSKNAALFAEDPWSNWGSSIGNPDWGVDTNDFGKMKRSLSFDHVNENGDEPDLSWVHSLVKEQPAQGINESGTSSDEDTNSSSQIEPADQSGLGVWLE